METDVSVERAGSVYSASTFHYSRCHPFSDLFAPDTLGQDLRKLFEEFDESRTGALNVTDLISVFAKMGTPLTRQKANAMILEVDMDGNSVIDYVEFLMVSRAGVAGWLSGWVAGWLGWGWVGGGLGGSGIAAFLGARVG